MKKIIVSNQKGGAGKTTLTFNLAIAAERQQKKIVVTDTDPQGTFSFFWKKREAKTPQYANISFSELAANFAELEGLGFDFMFIDTPPTAHEGTEELLKYADFIIIPVQPSPADINATAKTVTIAKKLKIPFCFVVTRAKGATRLTSQTIALLSSYGEIAPVIIQDREEYKAALTDGSTVFDNQPKGKAAAEITELWQFLDSKIYIQETEQELLKNTFEKEGA